MAIEFEQVSFAYDERSLWRHSALEEVDLRLADGVFAGIAGASGSGKSTLLQHFNGILKPTGGKVRVLDVTMEAGGKMRRCGSCGAGSDSSSSSPSSNSSRTRWRRIYALGRSISVVL